LGTTDFLVPRDSCRVEELPYQVILAEIIKFLFVLYPKSPKTSGLMLST